MFNLNMFNIPRLNFKGNLSLLDILSHFFRWLKRMVGRLGFHREMLDLSGLETDEVRSFGFHGLRWEPIGPPAVPFLTPFLVGRVPLLK